MSRRGSQDPKSVNQMPFEASGLTDTLTFSLSAIFCSSLIVVSVGKIKLVNLLTSAGLLAIKEKFVFALTFSAFLYSPLTEISDEDG